MERLLKKLYYNLQKPGSFTGINSLYQAAKRVNPAITKSTVKKFLDRQHVYLRHLRVRKPKSHSLTHTRYVTKAHGINWSCDTARFRNSKMPYVLVCKDNFSGQTYARVQRNLKSGTTLRNFNRMIAEQNDSKLPHTIYTGTI